MNRTPAKGIGPNAKVPAPDEPLLVDFLRHAGVLLLSTGTDGKIRYANETFHTLLGYTQAQVANGMHVLEIVSPESHERFKELLGQVFRGQSVDNIDAVFLTMDHHRIHVRGECDLSSLPDGEQVIRYLFRDVTAEHEARDGQGAMEERFRAVAEVLIEGIAILDAEGVVEYLNQSAEEILAVESSDVRGEKLLDLEWSTELVDGTPLAREEHPSLVAIESGRAQPEIVVGIRTPAIEGAKWVSMSAGPLVRIEDGVVYGSVCSFRDVTAQREAELALRASEDRFATLASQAPVGIFQAAPNGDCVYINEAFSEMSGLTMEAAAGEGWAGALHRDDRDHTQQEWRDAAREGRPFRAEYRLVRPDGTSTWVMGAATALYDEDGEVSGFLGSITDISHRHEAERLKDELISLVSHELRGPLSTIRGGLRYLGDSLDRLGPEAARYYELAARNTDYLVRLTSELLDIEKLEAGRVHLTIRELALSDVFMRARELVSDEAEGLDIVCQPTELRAKADIDRLLQVLRNLLANAIKFSPSGEEVRVSATMHDGLVRVSVADRGRGIPQHTLASVFDRFFQVDPSDAGPRSGSGLGLAITKALVEQMGGSIWAESEVGQGSTFHFTLPAP